MVNLVRALDVKYSSTVELEFSVSGNGHSHRLYAQGQHHLLGGVLGHVSETRHFEGTGVLLAFSVSGSVGVGVFGGDSVFLHKFKSVVHESAIAAVVLFGTVDQSLFGESLQFSVLDGIQTFEGAHSGESPAGSALTLIFGGGHGSVFSPVDGLGERLSTQDVLLGIGGLFLVAEVLVGELLESEVHEVVLGHGEGSGLAVVVVDEVGVDFENLEFFLFLGSAIGLAVFDLPGSEAGGHGVFAEESHGSVRLRYVH